MMYLPATGIPAANGLHPKLISSVLDLISKGKSISLNLVEYNSQKDYSHSSLAHIHKILNDVILM